jgi:hypothetical protein
MGSRDATLSYHQSTISHYLWCSRSRGAGQPDSRRVTRIAGRIAALVVHQIPRRRRHAASASGVVIAASSASRSASSIRRSASQSAPLVSDSDRRTALGNAHQSSAR